MEPRTRRPRPTVSFNSIAEQLAEVAHETLTNPRDIGTALDGDQTAEIARLFLHHLDKLNGNV